MVCGMHTRVVFLEDYVAISHMGKCSEHARTLEATDSQLRADGASEAMLKEWRTAVGGWDDLEGLEG